MNLLLDTHTFLWYADGNPQLSQHAAALLADPANALYLSVASVWEVAIKVNIGKLKLSTPYPVYMSAAISGYGMTVLPITLDDCERYTPLTFPLANHRDPFDRMLIAQSLRLGFPVVGADANFDAYVSYPWYGVWGFWPGWGWYAPGFDASWGIVYPWYPVVGVTQYDVGTLVVNLIPTASVDSVNKTVSSAWVGVATGLLNTGVTSELISAAIDQMFIQSPYLTAPVPVLSKR